MSFRRTRLMAARVVVGGCALLSGCATIVHLVELRTERTLEPAGAKVVIDGAERGVSLMTVKVERNGLSSLS